MGFLDKAKAAAEQAAAKAKEGVEEVQTKRELSQAYNELGKATLELIDSGEISHSRLEPLAARIRTLNERAASDEAGATTADETADTHEPAMPT